MLPCTIRYCFHHIGPFDKKYIGLFDQTQSRASSIDLIGRSDLTSQNGPDFLGLWGAGIGEIVEYRE
jgi:hypothetical protein